MSSTAPSVRRAIAGLFLVSMATACVADAAVQPGEILIAEMNCAACHEASGPVKARLASRQSPRLGADGPRLTPQWMRAFLLDPQAEKPGTLMPDMLAGLPQPQRAEIADALTHYLVSVQKPDAGGQAGASSAAIRAGEALYHSVGCVACHAPVAAPKGADAAAVTTRDEIAKLAAASVPLGDLAKKYTVTDLAAFIRDPLKTRPSGRMPAMNLTEGEAEAVAMYLLREQVPASGVGKLRGLSYDYYEVSLPELPHFERMKPTTSGVADTFTLAVAGRKNDYALRFRGTIAIPKDGEYTFSTASDDGSRLYLDEKAIVENDGLHPTTEKNGKVQLKAGEHTFRVEYFDGGGLTELKVEWEGPDVPRQEIPASVLAHEGQPLVPLGAAPFTVDAAKAGRGRFAYEELQCAKCHGPLELNWDKSPLVPAARPLAQLLARQPAGCLSPVEKPNVPHFAINDRQRVVLLAALGYQAALTEPLTPEQQVVRTMTVLNCYACHNRDRRGGPEGLKREYFTTAGEVDLGDEGRMPPALSGVGAKLKTDWIKAVLWKGGAVRPYMATHMPQFGEANVRELPELFEKADVADKKPAELAVDPALAKYGRKLVGVGGLTCVACHVIAGRNSLGIPAIDLSKMTERLQSEWFRRYLLDPQSLRPGTRMPAFWPNGVASNKEVLGGDAGKQIDAIWSYLSAGKNVDLPNGLVQGKMELVAEKEAVIYRNFIEGAGSRAIGVGYPEKANLAFDANEMRLALIWQGPFIDAAKHRTGRGEGFEKPLGGDVVNGPPGAPFAVLESESAAWPKESGKAAGWQFKGYALDEKRRPAFHYSWSGVDFADYPIAVTGDVDAGFKRTFSLHADQPPAKLYFRAAVADKITEQSRADGASFLVGEALHLKFPGAKPIIRVSEGKTELLVPITFAGKDAKFVEEITW